MKINLANIQRAVKKIIPERFAKLASGEVKLNNGAHDDFAEGHCAMEVVAWMAGETHSDQPRCVSPMIAEISRAWNDSFEKNTTKRTALMAPLLPLMVGTRDNRYEKRRGYIAWDWAIRDVLPQVLRLAGEVAAAEKLERLKPITDSRTLDYAGLMVGQVYAALIETDSFNFNGYDPAPEHTGFAAVVSGAEAAVGTITTDTETHRIFNHATSRVKGVKRRREMVNKIQAGAQALLRDLCFVGSVECEAQPQEPAPVPVEA